MTPTYFPYQMEAVKFAYPLLLTQGAAYIGHPTGMGKTLTAITLARLLKPQKVLVVTTKAGLGVWRQEVQQWWGHYQSVVIDTANGTVQSPAMLSQQLAVPLVYVINYDKLSPPVVKALAAWQPDLLILDEAQRVKSVRAKRTAAVLKLRKASKKALLLSGTPAHTPLDYWAQYQHIAPHERPWCLRYAQYREYICKLEGPYRTWVKGFKKEPLEDVEREVARFMHVADKSELKLPEPLRTTVPVELDDREKAAYRAMESRLRVELPSDREATAQIVLTKMLRQQQITSGFLRDTQGVDHPLGSSKLEVLLDLLEDRLDQKVVVSFLYAYERRAIEAALELAKRSHACIDGHTSDRARTGIVGAFQEGKIDVLLLQARAGGTSITLTRADCLIKFCQLSGVPDNTQLEGRIHRIGTTTHVQYIDLIVSGTIDEYLQQGLAAKMDQVSLASLLKRRMGL